LNHRGVADEGAGMKILAVDDHPLVRDAMASLLRRLSASTMILEAADCESAMALAQANPDIDLVVLDLNLPGTRGFEALDRFHREQPAMPVVILSMVQDRHTVLQAIKHGAMGFIPKSAAQEIIVSAAQLVLAGGVYLPPEALAGPADDISGDPIAAARAIGSVAELGLTPRQGQVLAQVMRGKTNKEICRSLGLAERTVKVHLTAVLAAFKVSTRTQAVIAATELGLNPDELMRLGAENDSPA